MNLENKPNNWQEKAPTLAGMEKKNPFLVPDGYFESLSTRIQSRVAAPQVKRMWPLWLNYAAAACITLALGITLYVNLNQQEINFKDIPDQEIVNYLESQMDDTDAEFIFANLAAEQTLSSTYNYTNKEVEFYLKETL